MGRRASDWAPAAVVFAAGIAAWEGLVRGLDVQRFLLPPLSDILQAIREDPDTFITAGRITFIEALGGFGIGCAAAFLAALALARWRPLGAAVMPYAIAANAVPIIAFAPITNNWFGGSANSLGTKIRQSAGYFDFETAWAAIIVASVLGIVFYGAVALAERFTMSWHPSARAGRSE